MSGFTKLEAAVLDAICRQHPEYAEAFRAQLDTAVVTLRENSGSGMFTHIAVDPSSPPADPPWAAVGDVTSTVEGVEIHFMLFTKSGFADFIEGYLLQEGDTSKIDLTTAEFTPPVLLYEPC